MVSPQFRPLTGGYERAAERLAGAVSRSRHAVTVVTERRSRAWPSVESSCGFEIKRLWCIYRRGAHLMTAMMSLAVFLLSHGRRYDVWHIHQYGYQAAVAIVIARLLRRPVVLKVTNTKAQGIRATLGTSRWLPRALAGIHRNVQACVVTTAEAASEAKEFGIPAELIWYIPNGIDPEKYCPIEPAQKLELQRQLGVVGEGVVVFVGRLAEAKNIPLLIRAWKVVSALRPGACLVLVGDGPCRNMIEEAVRIEGLASVRIVGEQADTALWYQCADVFVLVSRHEGLSNSLLEALATGLPVVTTRVSGSEEILRDSEVGHLVQQNDEQGLAQAILGLLEDDERRRRLGQNGRAYAVENYSIDSVAKKTIALYERLVPSNGE